MLHTALFRVGLSRERLDRVFVFQPSEKGSVSDDDPPRPPRRRRDERVDIPGGVRRDDVVHRIARGWVARWRGGSPRPPRRTAGGCSSTVPSC